LYKQARQNNREEGPRVMIELLDPSFERLVQMFQSFVGAEPVNQTGGVLCEQAEQRDWSSSLVALISSRLVSCSSITVSRRCLP
jgi:hypothetical protein